MCSSIIFLFAVVYTQSVYSSVQHGAIAHPVVLHNGYLTDTHGVALAKSAHLAAHSNSHLSHGYSGHNGYGGNYEAHGDYRYHGPIAIPHVLHDGHIADTHEVAAAKAEHFTAVAKAKAHGGYNSHDGYDGSYGAHAGYNSYNGYGGSNLAHGDYRYHGPIAIPHVLQDGHIADTHEVAAAKAEHFTAVAKAKAHGGYNSHDGYDGSYGAHAGYNSYNGYGGSNLAHGDYRYHGPIAIPYVLHDGHIADTHEVAAAKAEHLAAVARVKSHEHDYSGHYAGAYRHHVAAYHGPLAKPVVLPSGYLVDTHEVAAAKNHHIHLLTSSHSSHH